MNNNGGIGGSIANKQQQSLGKSNGLEFNNTQPIQLSASMQNASSGGNKSSSGFGITQPGLQKILRQLGQKPTGGPSGSSNLSISAAAANSKSNEIGQSQKMTSALSGPQTSQSSKNMSSNVVPTQRKSSSHKGRRVDLNALNQSTNGPGASQSIATSNSTNLNHHHSAKSHQQQRSSEQQHQHQNNQTATSSIVTSASHGSTTNHHNIDIPTASAKGRTVLKNQIIGDNIGKLPGRASRNPRNAIDGVPLLPPPSQSNTNPVMANHQSLSFNQQPQQIQPTMGMESGGGMGMAHQIQPNSNNSQIPVARSQSGKRLQRASDGSVPLKQSNHQKTPNGKFISTHHSQSNNQGSSQLPLSSSTGGEQQSRFAQRDRSGGGPGGTLKQQAFHNLQTDQQHQQLHTADSAMNAGSQQSASGAAKYFSQRISNQLRNKNSNNNDEKGNNGGSNNGALRSSKDELLRAFINPISSDATNKAANDELKPVRQQSADGKPIQDSNSSNFTKQRFTSRSQGKVVQSGLNEIGGFHGSSLEKIQAKANKIIQSSGNTNNGLMADERAPANSGGLTSSKSQLPQAANSFRAKLLRSHESNNKNGEGNGTNSTALPNVMMTETTNKLAQKAKDEPQIIQNALESLKKSLNKNNSNSNNNQSQQNNNTNAKPQEKERMTTQQKKAAEAAKRKEEEKNLGPDDIVEYRGMKMTVSQREEYMEMEEEQIIKFRQNYYPAKFASKKNGVVVTYAANTHQGMVRNYNEDRVSIILNIIKPKFKQIDFWPRCSFFAIYDGHGGAQCADFLRDQLHQMVVRDPDFPQNPIKAMQRGFEQAEKNFLEFAHSESNIDAGNVQRSGSCAIVVLIIGEVCYVANVGDSRAFMSIDSGTKIVPLSIDHKPENQSETERIEGNGGKVYQNQSYIPDPSPGNPSGTQTLIGPHRVFPGRLSVSRTIGDIEAKDERYGGNPNVVIATPEIRAFKIKDNYDFIVIGCDGVFEKMDNQEVMEQVWEASLQPENLKSPQTMHARCGAAVDGCLNECVNQKTLDNITCVIVGFNNFEKLIERARTTGARNDKIRDASVVAEEIDLDWDYEMSQIEEADQNKVFNKLMKPLEPVEEEMIENSELETPLSEVIDVTRKKIQSKTQLAEGANESHNSSVSDRYASSSRRQSQLLEAQDTTNLIDHDLLNQRETVSLTNSRKSLKKNASNVDQSQTTNAAMEEEQAGIAQRKSAAQGSIAAAMAAPTQQSQNGEQASTKTTIVQKDYKIRQTSASPARIQHQNSDRIFKDKPAPMDQHPLQPPSLQTYVKPSLIDTRSSNVAQYHTQQQQPPSNMISIPNGQAIVAFNTNQIPQSKVAKTPNNPNKSTSNGNGGSRNLIELKNSQEQRGIQQKSLSTQTGKSGQRPITPKRIILQKKPDSTQVLSQQVVQQSNSAQQHTSKNTESNKYHSNIVVQKDSVLNSSAPQQQNLPLSGKNNTKSHSRRKEDIKLDEVMMGKFAKKMVSNWVGPTNSSSTQSATGAGNLSANNGIQQQNQNNTFTNSLAQNNSFQNTGNQKGISSKSYLTTTNSNNLPQKQKNRTQRVNESIQNLINTSNPNPDLPKDHQFNDIASQFNTFNGQTQMLGKTNMMQDQKQQQSGSNPPRTRKKSGGKASLGNKSMRMANMASAVTGSTQREITEPAINNATFHQQLPQATTKRTSASRNKPNYLQPSSGSGQNNMPNNNHFQQQLNNSQGHGQNTGPNITLNFNQINLTTGSSRVQQHHVPTISQGQIGNNTQNVQMGNVVPGSQKQWYSNTINLAGIKQLSANALKQAQQQINQSNSAAAQQQQQNTHAGGVRETKSIGAGQGNVIKRLRD